MLVGSAVTQKGLPTHIFSNLWK